MDRETSTFTDILENVESNDVVLADFCTESSTPCHTQRLVLDRLSDQIGQKAAVIVVDVDKYRELATTFRITSIPTLILFKKGSELERHVGLQKAEKLYRIIESAIEGLP